MPPEQRRSRCTPCQTTPRLVSRLPYPLRRQYRLELAAEVARLANTLRQELTALRAQARATSVAGPG